MPKSSERIPLLDEITGLLKTFSQEELVSILRDFLRDLGTRQQITFLERIEAGVPPVVAESLGLGDIDDLLNEIQALREDIANDTYVTEGVGYDPRSGQHRGYGDDGWVDEMDRLFAATTSLYHAGEFEGAATAYEALFRIFELDEGEYHFTASDPSGAIHTDLDAAKRNLFIAIGHCNPNAAAKAAELSDDLRYIGANRYSLLDAWQAHPEWLLALETVLTATALEAAQVTQPIQTIYGLTHRQELLRELYRRIRTPEELERLCEQIGALQGWLFEDIVQHYTQQEDWTRVLYWAEDGLSRLPGSSQYRQQMQQARAEALIKLDRLEEALDELRRLFDEKISVTVYIKIRQVALSLGRWREIYPLLVARLQSQPLDQARPDTTGLLGLAYLIEGDDQLAVGCALSPTVKHYWGGDDVMRIVTTGLLHLALGPAGAPSGSALARQLETAPAVIRENMALLTAAGQAATRNRVLDGAIRLYERLVQRGIDQKQRSGYATAAQYCTVIKAIRAMQERSNEFDIYYRNLHSTYVRFSALRDELRRELEGPTRWHR